MRLSSRSFDTIILGAGLAGASTAFALIRRGAKVAVIESADRIADKGSGNPCGLITPYISLNSSPMTSFYSAGYDFTQDLLASFPEAAKSFKATGALQLPSTKRLKNLIDSDAPVLGVKDCLRVSSDRASDLAGTTISYPAIYISDAGFISPRDFSDALINYRPAQLITFLNKEVVSLEQDGTNWVISSRDGIKLTTRSIVLCTAADTVRFTQSSWLPLEPIRGQTVVARCSTASKCVISYGGYITPINPQEVFIGAHYSHEDIEPNPRDTDTESIIDLCTKWLPNLGLLENKNYQPRVCFRASTIDRLPYIGALPDFHLLCSRASEYRSGTDLQSKINLETIAGLYINAGHGSRGLISCPMGGEIIARLISGENQNELEAAALISSPSRLPWRLLRSS